VSELPLCVKCGGELLDGGMVCPICGNSAAPSPGSSESVPEQLLMNATDVVLHRESEKPKAFRGKWGTLILTSRRLVFLPSGLSGVLGFSDLLQLNTLESVNSALTKQGSLQIPIYGRNAILELKVDSAWGNRYLKVRSQDQTGQKLNLFLENRGNRDSREHEWNLKEGKWSTSGEGILTSRPRWDVWIQKMNSLRAGSMQS
jgi:hypothetical protein